MPGLDWERAKKREVCATRGTERVEFQDDDSGYRTAAERWHRYCTTGHEAALLDILASLAPEAIGTFVAAIDNRDAVIGPRTWALRRWLEDLGVPSALAVAEKGARSLSGAHGVGRRRWLETARALRVALAQLEATL